MKVVCSAMERVHIAPLHKNKSINHISKEEKETGVPAPIVQYELSCTIGWNRQHITMVSTPPVIDSAHHATCDVASPHSCSSLTAERRSFSHTLWDGVFSTNECVNLDTGIPTQLYSPATTCDKKPK